MSAEREHILRFNRALNSLMNMFERKSRTDEQQGLVLKIKAQISAARMASDSYLIGESIDLFGTHYQPIEDRSEEFIKNFKPEESFADENGQISSDAQLYVDLAHVLRLMYENAIAKDKAEAWTLLTEMRDSAVNYGILVRK